MDAPNNEKLARAILDVLDAPNDEMAASFRVLLDELLASTLIAGEDDGEPSTLETDDGEVLLAVFTDQVELFAFDAGAKWVTITAEDAIRRVARGDYDGLVINPAGRAFELSGEDMEEMFEIDDED